MLAGLKDKMFGETFKATLSACERNLEENLEYLHRIFYIDNKAADLPLAFATNSMYVLAKNGQAGICQERMAGDLLDLVLAKKEHLHAEGVS